jgi:hypothetical protein
MNEIEVSLFLALAEEHRHRTGHDIFKMDLFDTRRICCNVCMHLSAVNRAMNKAEEDHYRAEMDAASKSPPANPKD